MKKYLVIFLISSLFAVGEAGAVFLLISPSASANGLGSSAVSNYTSDIYSSYYNPAHSKLPNGLSFEYSDMDRVNWLPNLADDIFIESNVKRISYNGEILRNSPFDFQLAITQLKLNLNLGEQIVTDSEGNMLGTFNSNMSSNSTTFSLGIKSREYPVYFSVGRTKKKAIQNLAPTGAGFEESSASSTDNFYDWGFKFIIDNYRHPNFKTIGLSYSLGYSKSNIGDDIWFQDKSQADPSPRNARLGMSWGARLNPFKDDWGLGISFIHEAEDLLIIVDSDEQTRIYDDGFLGDIHIIDHIFRSKPDNEVVIHKGMELNLLDIYYIRSGKYIDDAGRIDIQTEGFGINYSQLGLLILSALKSQDILNNDFILNMNSFFNIIDIQRNYSEYNGDTGHTLDNIEFNEVTFSFNYKF